MTHVPATCRAGRPYRAYYHLGNTLLSRNVITTSQLTEDANIQFMAVACVFSLTQSPELCPDIAKTAATELALNALAQGRPGEESEVLLVHLAVVAQMTEGPRFCRRLASPTTIDLLMRLALVTPPREKAEISSSARFDETKEGWTEEKRSDGNGGDNRTTCDAGGDGVRGVGDKFNSTQSDTTKKTSIAGNGGLEDRNIDADSGGGELASAKRGSGVVEDGGRCSSDKNEKRRVNRQPLPCIKRFSGSSVKVASPYMGALRYCVVTIAEHIGEIFDREHGSGESSAEGGGGAGNGSTSSLSDVTQMVVSRCRPSIMFDSSRSQRLIAVVVDESTSEMPSDLFKYRSFQVKCTSLATLRTSTTTAPSASGMKNSRPRSARRGTCSAD